MVIAAHADSDRVPRVRGSQMRSSGSFMSWVANFLLRITRLLARDCRPQLL